MTKKGCLKLLGIVLLAGVIATTAAIYIMSEELPPSHASTEADEWAEEMMQAIGKESYDSTRFFQWTFFRPNHYSWDKEENRAIVNFDQNEVLLDLNQSKGAVLKPIGLDITDQKDILAKAWNNWCNDSFWLFAPFKIMDEGTTRSISTDKDGKKGLLVEYSLGGTTPGDSYLWYLDNNKVPTGFKMWTSILPVKGMYASWEGWKDYKGIKLSDTHKIKMIEAKIKNLKVGNAMSEMNWPDNLFETEKLISY